EILKDSGVSPLILSAVRSHHEWVSGGGYPDNTSGDQVPLIAKMVGIADAFDAMVSNRPYRRGCSIDEARDRLGAARDRQFDGLALDAFFALLDSMSADELQTIGYGQEPPNSSIEPVAELPNSTTTLAERLQAIISQAQLDERQQESTPLDQVAQSDLTSEQDGEVAVAVGEMLMDALRSQGLDASSTSHLLSRLGPKGLATVVLEAAAGLEEIQTKPPLGS
ncbi:MAG: hypothetical protein OWT28_04505, partial [Firmicutes bacterium]|nr:hypothetical protein [Bacillota bacterium]